MATQATINKHARARMKELCVAVEFARKKQVRHATGSFSVAEDLFDGCFDAVGFQQEGTVMCVQWTSDNTGAISYRKRKIAKAFCDPFAEGCLSLRYEEWQERKRAIESHCIVELWAWVARSGFRRFRWDWMTWTWRVQEFSALPTRRANPKAAAAARKKTT